MGENKQTKPRKPPKPKGMQTLSAGSWLQVYQAIRAMGPLAH